MGGYCLWINGRNNQAGVSRPGGIPSVTAHDTQDFAPHPLGIFQRPHQIVADIFLFISSADREDEYSIVMVEVADLKPFDEDRVPPFIIDPRRQFRHVVAGRVAFDAGDFSEVVDGMGGVPGTATNAQEVSGAIQGVAEVTEQSAAGSEEMASSSEELGAQATALRDLVARFKTDNAMAMAGETADE